MLLTTRVVAKNRLKFDCFACNVELFKPGLNIHVQYSPLVQVGKVEIQLVHVRVVRLVK